MYLFISDPHIDNEQTLDIYLDFYNGIIEQYGVRAVLSAGDNDLYGKEFADGLNTPFYTIYGNHDVPNLNNLKDGINEVVGLKIFAFNGIMGFFRKKWYHRSLDDLVRLVFRNQKEMPDIVITHDVPYGVTVPSNIRVPAYLGTVTFASQMMKPKYHFYGHLHDRLTLVQFDKIFDTIYVRMDSSMYAHGFLFDMRGFEKVIYMKDYERRYRGV